MGGELCILFISCSSPSYDVAELPDTLEPSSREFTDAALTNYARTKGILHSAGGQVSLASEIVWMMAHHLLTVRLFKDYWVWNQNGRKLIRGPIPPFIHGKSKFDNWIVHEVIQGGYRDVIDGTEAVVPVHVLHDYKRLVEVFAH